MIFIVHSVKMTTDRGANPAIQVSESETSPSYFKRLSQTLSRKRTKKQAAGDLLIVLVAVPLLVTCSILLHSCMQKDWVRDSGMRWRILSLGLSLLFVSLMVCMYATHRLGLCIWGSQQQQETHARIRRRTLSSRGVLPGTLPPNESQMQLVVGGEYPPSYESIIEYRDFPPPYCSIMLNNEKAEVTRSSAAAHLSTG